MTTFTIGGQQIRVLDMDSERGNGKVYSENIPTFAETALEEAKDSTAADKKHKFMTVYSEACISWRATSPEDIIRISLVGQSYVCPRYQKRLIQSNVLMVFYQKNGNFVPLYKLHHLQPKKHYIFLDKEELTQKLSEVFNTVKLTLGQLLTPNLKCIAWRAKTEEGDFYILWHNGSIIKAQDYLVFEERNFKDIKNTYELLRFTPSLIRKDAYTVLCC